MKRNTKGDRHEREDQKKHKGNRGCHLDLVPDWTSLSTPIGRSLATSTPPPQSREAQYVGGCYRVLNDLKIKYANE